MSKFFWGLAFVGVATAAAGPGCSDGGNENTGGNGAGSGTVSSSNSASSTSSGVEPDTNTSCDTAEPMPEQLEINTTLQPIETDEDFYTFDGAAGQLFYLVSDSKPDTDEFSSAYPDLVITLYKNNNGAWEQVAQNDDPSPRFSNDSELFTVLEAGKYCLRVTECNVVYPDQCSPTGDITTFDYGVAGVPIDPAQISSIFQEAEPNDDPPGSPVEYGKNMQTGNYFQSIGYGTFSTDTDLDIFSFAVPTDTKVTEGRPTCYFDFYPTGPNGDGSTADTDISAYVTTEADLATEIARVDVTKADPKTGSLPSLGFPCVFGTKYLLWLERGAVTAGKNDFYIFSHLGGGSNPVEAETASMPNTNDKGASAEIMMPYDNKDGTFSYFIEGDLIPAAADVDVFAVDLAANPALSIVSIACGAQRIGSGLRGFRLSLLDEKENPIGTAIATESDASDVYIPDVSIPAGQAKIFIKLQAATQSPSVVSTFYRCGVHLAPPSGG